MSVEIKSNISLCISLIALIATLFLAKIQFDTFSETKAKFVVNAENFELIPINENELSGMHLLVGEVRFENKSNKFGRTNMSIFFYDATYIGKI